jgi:hypothetical protein
VGGPRVGQSVPVARRRARKGRNMGGLQNIARWADTMDRQQTCLVVTALFVRLSVIFLSITRIMAADMDGGFRWRGT